MSSGLRGSAWIWCVWRAKGVKRNPNHFLLGQRLLHISCSRYRIFPPRPVHQNSQAVQVGGPPIIGESLPFALFTDVPMKLRIG